MRGNCLRIAILFLIAGVLAASCFGEQFTGKCAGVADGDTITVLRDNRQVKVRLEGIDCPESGADFSNKAKRFTSAMVFGKTVQVRVKELDRYGRTVGRVFVDETDVSLELVRAGLAWHYTHYSSDQTLAEAERVAKAAGIGVWSLPNPLPPWEAKAAHAQRAAELPSGGNIYHGNVKSHVLHAPWCRY